LIVCGPGNNGGDGLVCARHLLEFGYSTIHISYPKRPEKKPFIGLSSACVASGLQIHSQLPAKIDGEFDVIVDAIFGYSFTGELRAPFDTILRTLKSSKVPIVALDIPSGWDVEKGNVTGQGLEVETLSTNCHFTWTSWIPFLIIPFASISFSWSSKALR